MFNPVSSHLDLPRLEEAIQRMWQVRHIFRKSQSLNAGATDFVFYESPTSISRLPGIQDVPARAIKDLILRYKTQRGFHTIRRAGWNTHGLPVERSVEEQLGIGGKAQIQAYGLGRFNEQCRRAVFVTLQDWNRLTERLAYWIDLEEAYVTHTQDYIESVWWALKTLWEQKLLVKQTRMVDYCPHCGTPLAGYEAGQGQTQTQSRSLLVRLPLAEDPGTSLLIRVLDPWMLPANTAVAAHPDEDYVIIERELDENPAGTGGIKERLILAKKFLPRLFGAADVKVYETFKGRQLKGLHYQPLFTYLLPEQDAYFVVNEPFEQFDDSTGLIHLAPAYDLFAQQTAERFNLPVFQILEPDGTFISQTGPWRGLFFKAAEEGIAAELDRRGLILKTEQVDRQTSRCIHCQTPLLTLARPAWFILTSAQTKRLAEIAQNPVWFPPHIQPELSQTWLTQNPDWLISRERFWGAPLPIWNCTACEHQLAVGSRGELSQLAGKELPPTALYRPFVDEIQFPCPNCGKPMQRVPDVLDTGFETSLMPFAQWHMPFENQELFSEQFPADLTITQPELAATWLNGLLTASGLLFNKEAFRSAVSVGPLEVGKDTPEFELWDIFNRFGADALRWTLYTCGPVWETCRMTSEQVDNTIHSFIQPLWELYSFFVENARSAKWTPGPATQVLALLRKVEYNTLERWLLSDLHSLIVLVTETFDLYDVHTSTTAIQAFLKRVTRWHMPHLSRSFGHGPNAAASSGFAALYETLLTLSKLIAPAAPHLAEELYQNLLHRIDENTPISVHLAGWPDSDKSLIDEDLNRKMTAVLRAAEAGESARTKAGIRATQPLPEIYLVVNSADEAQDIKPFLYLLAESLNTRQIDVAAEVGDRVSILLRLIPERLEARYPDFYPAVRDALILMEPEPAARQLLAGKPLELTLDGQHLFIQPEEVEIVAEAPSGMELIGIDDMLFILNTNLSQELIEEGYAQELIQRINRLRDQAEIKPDFPIHLRYESSAGLARAIHSHREKILADTNARTLDPGLPATGGTSVKIKIDDEKATLVLDSASEPSE